jgi:hypothetical protein
VALSFWKGFSSGEKLEAPIIGGVVEVIVILSCGIAVNECGKSGFMPGKIWNRFDCNGKRLQLHVWVDSASANHPRRSISAGMLER